MRRRWAGAVLFAALLVRTVGAQGEVAAQVARLGSQDPQQQYEGYRELQRTRPPEAIGLLARQLAACPLNGQSLGVSLLQQYPIEQTREAYRKFVADGGPFLRGASAAALLRAGDRGAATAVAEALGTAAAAERTMLLQRLYGLDDPLVGAALRALIRGGVPGADVESALYLLLSAPQREEAALRAAEALLAGAGGDGRARAACAAFLLACGETRHAPLVAEAIAADRSAVVRLARFLERAPGLGRELTAALAELLAGARNRNEVSLASRVLREHAESEAVAALRGLLAAEDAPVREAALEALSEIPGALDAETLRRMLASGEVGSVLVAADTLRRMDDPSGLARVLELVEAPGADRLRAVEVLGRFRARGAVPPLLDALDDADEAVRRTAFQALGRLLSDLFPYRRIDVSTTGYRAEAAPAERATATAALRRFWESAR
jgi:hypothetical protein